MIRRTAQERSATQRLDEIIEPLTKLRDKLESTEKESDDLLNWERNYSLVTHFNNITEQIQKELKRIYRSK
jgi:hypothetical protein